MDNTDTVLREIEEIGRKSNLPSIGPVKARILAEVVRKYKPKLILEVGALHGYSAIIMAKNAPLGAKVKTVELNPEHARITSNNVKRAGMDDRIEVVRGDGIQVLLGLKEGFDLVFLDAAKEQYLAYLMAVEKKIPKGGVVVADNVGIFENQMRDFLDHVRNSGVYKSRTVETQLEFSDERDAMEISEKLK